MIRGYDTYRIYVGMKTHFNKEEYDFKTYHGELGSASKYTDRNDRFYFERLGAKYAVKKELTQFLLSMFLNDREAMVVDMLGEEAEETFNSWKGRQGNMAYNFKEELNEIIKFLNEHNMEFDKLFQVVNGNHPIIFKMMIQSILSIETYCIILQSLGIEFDLDDFIFEEWNFKCKKYLVFLSVDTEKYKEVIKAETLNNLNNL